MVAFLCYIWLYGSDIPDDAIVLIVLYVFKVITTFIILLSYIFILPFMIFTVLFLFMFLKCFHLT